MAALLCPPHPTVQTAPVESAPSLRARWSSATARTPRAVDFGYRARLRPALVPWIIWLVGSRCSVLTRAADALRFIGDFFVGLGQGSPVFWVVALGPAAFLVLLRSPGYGVVQSTR